MENANFNPDEKRLLLKDYNHRLNNDLQAVLAFIKLKKDLELMMMKLLLFHVFQLHHFQLSKILCIIQTIVKI